DGHARLIVPSLSVGSHIIVAAYDPPADTYAGNSTAVAQVVNAAPTVTTVSSSVNPAVFGQPATLTAHVSAPLGVFAPTGVVLFVVDGVEVPLVPLDGSGNAPLTTPLDIGSHTVQAFYLPDNGNFTASQAQPFTEVVNPAPTATLLVASTSRA